MLETGQLRISSTNSNNNNTRERARRDEKTNAFPEEKKDVVLRDAARVETSDVVDARVVVVVVLLVV